MDLIRSFCKYRVDRLAVWGRRNFDADIVCSAGGQGPCGQCMMTTTRTRLAMVCLPGCWSVGPARSTLLSFLSCMFRPVLCDTCYMFCSAGFLVDWILRYPWRPWRWGCGMGGGGALGTSYPTQVNSQNLRGRLLKKLSQCPCRLTLMW